MYKKIMVKYTQMDLFTMYANDFIINLVNVYTKTPFNINQLHETKRLFKNMPCQKKKYKEFIGNTHKFNKKLGEIHIADNVIHACVATNRNKFDMDFQALKTAFTKIKKYCTHNNIKQINMSYDLIHDDEKLFTDMCNIATDIFEDDKIILNICLVF